MIQQTMKNKCSIQNIDKDVVTLVTQVKVNANDTAFKRSQKLIGPFYDRQQAEKLKCEKGWNLVEDAGRGYRRIVASPQPIEIVRITGNSVLGVKKGFTVISCGGGGISVTREGDSMSGSRGGR